MQLAQPAGLVSCTDNFTDHTAWQRELHKLSTDKLAQFDQSTDKCSHDCFIVQTLVLGISNMDW